MKRSEKEYLDKIGRETQRRWVKNLMVKKPTFEEEKERLLFYAKKHDNRKLKEIIDSGTLDRVSEEVNPKVIKEIDEFTSKQVREGIRRGVLKPKEDSQARRFRKLAGY